MQMLSFNIIPKLAYKSRLISLIFAGCRVFAVNFLQQFRSQRFVKLTEKAIVIQIKWDFLRYFLIIELPGKLYNFSIFTNVSYKINRLTVGKTEINVYLHINQIKIYLFIYFKFYHFSFYSKSS